MTYTTSQEIATHRALTQTRLHRLLEKAGIDNEPGLIEFIVLKYHHTRYTLFRKQMESMFKTGRKLEKGLISIVIQDVWNYLPHSSLQGRCPAEVFFSQLDGG